MGARSPLVHRGSVERVARARDHSGRNAIKSQAPPQIKGGELDLNFSKRRSSRNVKVPRMYDYMKCWINIVCPFGDDEYGKCFSCFLPNEKILEDAVSEIPVLEADLISFMEEG